MVIRNDGVAEISGFEAAPDANIFSLLWSQKIAALRVRNLVSDLACDHISKRSIASHEIIEHADVEGLRVVGLSHFQAVRDSHLAHRYFSDAKTSVGALRSIALPYASPFDSAVAFLTQCWPCGCQFMLLPTEGLLAPFTMRIYRSGVGIAPHQDILSAESPQDPIARSLAMQFGVNLYLSMGDDGGALEIFNRGYSTEYKDLSRGPHVVPRSQLGDPWVTIAPEIGELVIFPSHLIHSVTPSQGSRERITISFFIGMHKEQAPLMLWA